MKQMLTELSLDTDQRVQFVDITDRVRDAVMESGVREGVVSLFTRHTTTAVKVNERCDRLQDDMRRLLEKVIPQDEYRHDEATVDGRPNARGHIMSLLLGAGETIPVSNGDMMLGGWQSIFFVELDGPRTERKLLIKVIGE